MNRRSMFKSLAAKVAAVGAFLAVAPAAKAEAAPARDDSAYIQGIIDTAVARGETSVHIPAGYYVLSRPIDLTGARGLSITTDDVVIRTMTSDALRVDGSGTFSSAVVTGNLTTSGNLNVTGTSTFMAIPRPGDIVMTVGDVTPLSRWV